MGPTELVGARQWRGAGSSEGQAGERAVMGDAGTGSPSSALSHILLATSLFRLAAKQCLLVALHGVLPHSYVHSEAVRAELGVVGFL